MGGGNTVIDNAMINEKLHIMRSGAPSEFKLNRRAHECNKNKEHRLADEYTTALDSRTKADILMPQKSPIKVGVGNQVR